MKGERTLHTVLMTVQQGYTVCTPGVSIAPRNSLLMDIQQNEITAREALSLTACGVHVRCKS